MITVTSWVNGVQCGQFIDHDDAQYEVDFAATSDACTVSVDNTGTLIVNKHNGYQIHYANVYAYIPDDVAALVPYHGQYTRDEELARLDADKATHEATLPDYDALAHARMDAGLEPY